MFPFYSEEADKVEEDAEHNRPKLQKAETNEVTEEDSEDEDTESLEGLPYFHGDITRDEADFRLKEENIGTFLVRFKTSTERAWRSISK